MSGILSSAHSLVSDPQFIAALVLTLVTWFLTSTPGHDVVNALLGLVDKSAEKMLPAKAAGVVERFAEEAVTAAFAMGERLNLDNTGRLAAAKTYLGQKVKQFGLDPAMLDTNFVEAVIEAAWHDAKGNVLTQALHNVAAAAGYTEATSGASTSGTEAASIPTGTISPSNEPVDVASQPTTPQPVAPVPAGQQ